MEASPGARGPGFVGLVGRLLLALIFVTGGWDALRNPEPKVPRVEQAGVPRPELATRLNGFIMLVAGSALALQIWPRLSACVLATSLVPTTLAGHPFWRIEDHQQAAMQRIHFIKNLGLLGGLLGVMAAERRGERASA